MATDGIIPSSVDESTPDAPNLGPNPSQSKDNWRPIGALAAALVAAAARRREDREGDDD